VARRVHGERFRGDRARNIHRAGAGREASPGRWARGRRAAGLQFLARPVGHPLAPGEQEAAFGVELGDAEVVAIGDVELAARLIDGDAPGGVDLAGAGAPGRDRPRGGLGGGGREEQEQAAGEGDCKRPPRKVGLVPFRCYLPLPLSLYGPRPVAALSLRCCPSLGFRVGLWVPTCWSE
jgi:hypothetical protein